jgi:hypothetical protein
MITGLELVYLGRQTPYLVIKDMPTDVCVVCLESEKHTTSHHLIPVRSHPKNGLISRLRVRICDDCNKRVHMENEDIDGIAIIKRQSEQIANLKKQLEVDKTTAFSWLLHDLLSKRRGYIKDIGRIVDELKQANNYRAIHPTQKQMTGRIKENERVEGLIRHWIKTNRVK